MSKKKKNIWDAFLKNLDKNLEINKLHDPIKKSKNFIISDCPEGKGNGFVVSVKLTEQKFVGKNKPIKNVKKNKKTKIKKNKPFKNRFNIQGTGPKNGEQQRLNGGWFLPAPMRD